MKITAEEILDIIKREYEGLLNLRSYASENGKELLEEKCHHSILVLSEILNAIRSYEENADLINYIINGGK